jgi:transcriptional regulator GlxA family with amidase domain
MNIGIYIFHEVEVLDFAGPFEVFSTASRVYGRERPTATKLFDVFTVAESLNPVLARARLSVNPTYAIGNHPRLDVLIVPGGDVSAELENRSVISWISASARSAQVCASVCTGAFLLARAGLLQGRSVTTHWEDIEDMRRMFPSLSVLEGRRYIDEGNVVTSAGISAGIDMSLQLVSRLSSRKLAERSARQMEYDWRDVEPARR